MNSGLSNFHRILKDKTRSQIVLQLNEKGSLSYTDLMTTLGIVNTGKLNYHLKVLDDLVTKNAEGLYFLTEKGKLSARLLEEFKEKKSPSQVEAAFPKGFMILASVDSVVYVSVVFALYLSGRLDLSGFVLNTIAAISAIILLTAAEKARKKRANWSPTRQMLAAKISITAAVAWGGAVVGFFGGGLLLSGLIWLLRKSNPFISLSTHNILDGLFWVGNPIIGAVIGGVIGYLVYRRSRFSKIRYYDPFA